MTPESINRYATNIFLAARTESNIGDATKLPLDTIITKGTIQVKREIIEFAVEVLQSVGRDMQHVDSQTLELISNRIHSLETLKWDRP